MVGFLWPKTNEVTEAGGELAVPLGLRPVLEPLPAAEGGRTIASAAAKNIGANPAIADAKWKPPCGGRVVDHLPLS